VGSFALNYAYNLAGELTSLTNPWGSVVGYGYDKAGRVTGVSGSGQLSAPSYAGSLTYRAFGGIKGMSYGNGKTLSTAYDNRLRMTTFDVATVQGYNYNYDYLGEHTGRVTYAQSIYDSTLDRSYQYDQVGRLAISHSGAEARAHAFSGQWGTTDGPYSHGYEYDVWGNMTHRYGWGGEVQGGSANQTSHIYAGFTNNRRNGFSYDAAGNLTNDLGQTFTYDATGQQATASYMSVQQSYDGDGLRVKKTENGTTRYYLRSSVLGGQVVAEMDTSGTWMRGYVYQGGSLLAVQAGGVNWVHEDPVTKSKRVTDSLGNVVSATELDPWGGDTNRSSNAAFQPKKFTSYHRDDNGSDEAMFRRYNRWHSRFDQPDPYDGSYTLTDPQSFNRYAYVQNDPVNHTDPSGLEMSAFCGAEYSFSECGGGGGFWGGNFGGQVAEYNREYGGLPPKVVEAVRTYNERTANAFAGNGFKTNAELTRDFLIYYGYNDDGSLWTSFSISVDIGGTPYSPFSNLLGGSLDQWPPHWPRLDPNYGWRPRPVGAPKVTLPVGEPIKMTPQTGNPGTKVPSEYLNQPRVNPGNPRIPANLSTWDKIRFFIGAGARTIGNFFGPMLMPSS
jgi:RHS repeat-associated protein